MCFNAWMRRSIPATSFFLSELASSCVMVVRCSIRILRGKHFVSAFHCRLTGTFYNFLCLKRLSPKQDVKKQSLWLYRQNIFVMCWQDEVQLEPRCTLMKYLTQLPAPPSQYSIATGFDGVRFQTGATQQLTICIRVEYENQALQTGL